VPEVWRRQPALVTLAAEDLLRLLMHSGPHSQITRTSYARLRGISTPTASRAADILERSGLIRPGEEVHRRGRGGPAVALELNPDKFVLGLWVADQPPDSIGANGWGYSRSLSIYSAPVQLDGQVKGSVSETDITGADERTLTSTIARSIGDLGQHVDVSTGDLLGIGVALPGNVNGDTVRFSPNIGQSAFNVQKEVRSLLVTLPAAVPIQVEKDAVALARRVAFEARPTMPSSFAVVFMQEDEISCGMVVGGEVSVGVTGMAGEIGHVPVGAGDDSKLTCRCGNSGCLERVATLAAMAVNAGYSGRREAAIVKYLDALDRNEPAAQTALHRAAKYLGRAVAALISLCDPGPVLVYGPPVLVERKDYRESVQSAILAAVVKSARGLVDVRFLPRPSTGAVAAAAAMQILQRVGPAGE
jgi:predicted NBD/HSP70 family sugar kinase